MAISLTRVAGRFPLPDDTPPGAAVAIFSLSGVDREDADTVLALDVRSALNAAGEVEADLWPNGAGGRGTHYRVCVEVAVQQDFALPRVVTVYVGSMVVPESSAPVDVAALLTMDAPESTQADALLQAQAAAATAIAAAAAARDAAESTSGVDVHAFGAVADGVTDSSAAFQAALDACAAGGGGTVRATGQFYMLTTGLRIRAGVTLEGGGVDEWEPVYPQRPKRWSGTSLIFKGTGTRNVTFPGITSMRYGGGWREDPDSPGSHFKLTNFQASDAAGTVSATPRQFSVAVMNADGAHYIGLRDLRIVNWSGTDGRAGHSDTGSSSLGDVWDIGLCLRNSEYALIENVQVVGGWREFAHLEAATVSSESRSERNRRVRCKFQGRIGVGVRAPDRWDVSATTANSATIRWSEESYWASTGSFRGSDGVTRTYSGLSRSGSNLIFTGVSPDPTGIFQIRHVSTGFGNGEFQDCYAYGLHHVSGATAAALGLADSKPFEISGYPLRGLKFRNFKAHSREAVVGHIHDASDLIFSDPQFEGGGHVIASPVNTEATYAAAAVGETRNIVMLGDAVNECDLRLFLPRSGFIQGLSVNPRSDLTGDFILTPSRDDRDIKAVMRDGKNFRVTKSDGTTSVLRITETGNVLIEGGQLSLVGGSATINADAAANIQIRNGTTTRLQIYGGSGNVAPGADNAQACGTSGLRWSTIYAGTGTINTSDGREKCDVAEVAEAEKRVAQRLKGMIRKFRFRDAVAAKGAAARIHFGVIAQDVAAAFAAEGLDASRYAILCHDEWPDQADDMGNIIPGGDRYGVRYEELLAFILGAL